MRDESGGREVTIVKEDTTVLLPCRQGDHLLWIRSSDLFSPDGDLQIVDLWEFRPGDSVTITNRYDDLPEWFELTPGEARGHAAYALQPKVKAGETPDTPLEGANIWRVLAGDRLAWIGHSRPGNPADEGILTVFDCATCCLAAGQPRGGSLEDWQTFGALSTSEPDADALEATRRALDIVRVMGPGSVRLDGWAIG